MADRTESPAADREPISAGNRAGTVLIVCTANQYRSPLAEALLREALVKLGRTDIAVRSAGTDAVTGAQIADSVLIQLARDGIHPTHTSARPLTSQLVERADLILTAERSHRSKVVRLSPWPTGRPSPSSRRPDSPSSRARCHVRTTPRSPASPRASRRLAAQHPSPRRTTSRTRLAAPAPSTSRPADSSRVRSRRSPRLSLRCSTTPIPPVPPAGASTP